MIQLEEKGLKLKCYKKFSADCISKLHFEGHEKETRDMKVWKKS